MNRFDLNMLTVTPDMLTVTVTPDMLTAVGQKNNSTLPLS